MSDSPPAETSIEGLYKLNKDWLSNNFPALLNSSNTAAALAMVTDAIPSMITVSNLDPSYQTRFGLLAVDLCSSSRPPDPFATSQLFTSAAEEGFVEASATMAEAFRPVHVAIVATGDTNANLSKYLAAAHHAIVSKVESVLQVAFELEFHSVQTNLQNGDTPDQIRRDLQGLPRLDPVLSEDFHSLDLEFF